MKKEVEVVAAIIVRNDGKILCAQRGKGSNPEVAEKWEFPGGKIEKNEAPETALQRELSEEMDLQIQVQEKFLTVCHDYETLAIRLQAFYCKLNSESMQPNLREHLNYQWLLPAELNTLDWAPADLPIAQKLQEQLAPTKN